jgi:hypothetical protein
MNSVNEVTMTHSIGSPISMTKNVYLITGFIGMGKDHLMKSDDVHRNYSAFYLHGECELPTTFRGMERHSFAQILRDLIQPLFGITICDEMYNKIKDDRSVVRTYNGSIRDYFKEISIGIKRVDQEFFAKSVVCRIINSESDNFVITDLRFPEELETIVRELPGYVIRVIRVHRAAGPDPNLEAISENSLLNLSPDVVLLTNDNKEDDMVSYNTYYENKLHIIQ